MSITERRQRIADMRDLGVKHCADVLGVSERTVVNDRKALGLTGVVAPHRRGRAVDVHADRRCPAHGLIEPCDHSGLPSSEARPV